MSRVPPESGSWARPKRAQCVDKFFTYATPHNGIEMAGSTCRSWLPLNDINNFNRERMAKYLDLKAIYRKTKRVDWLPEEAFPSAQVFCMVGTNRTDYESAAGLSRTFAGHGSDGLVRVENASVWGVNAKGQFSAPSATAYAYRSHSGYFGIVNSEEAYQNLVRFLFGDVRVDIWVDVDDVRVPQELEQADKDGTLDALYQFEMLGRAAGQALVPQPSHRGRGFGRVPSHRELSDAGQNEDGAPYLPIHRVPRQPLPGEPAKPTTLAYSADARRARARLRGREELLAEPALRRAIPLPGFSRARADSTAPEGGDWDVAYDWQSDDVGQSSTPIPTKNLRGGNVEVTVPFSTGDATAPRSPGITGALRFTISKWN